jgi:hypothetical protein
MTGRAPSGGRAVRAEPVRVTTPSAPEPGFLRPAIEARLAGRAWPPGAEATVADAVAAAVARALVPTPEPGGG